MAKKIYRTVVRYEILSDEPTPTHMSLADIDYQTSEGHMSGAFLDAEVFNEELTGTQAAEHIKKQGSDPEFFQMDEEGNDISDEDEGYAVLTPVWDEDFHYEYEKKSDLSYRDEGHGYVELLHKGTRIALIKVYQDSEMEGREYIIINHTINYLDELTKEKLYKQ